MWADKTAVWAAGSDVRSANYAAFFFWLRLAALYFFFPLTLMTLLFDLVNNANSYFLYLGTGVKWGCDQPCACPRRSSHLLLTSPGALCSFANRPSPVLCPTVASQIPAPSRLSVLSFYIVDTLTNQPGIIFHSLQAGFLIYSPHPAYAYAINLTLCQTKNKNVFHFIFKVPLVRPRQPQCLQPPTSPLAWSSAAVQWR